MPDKPDPKKPFTHDDLLMAQMIQIDTIALLLVEKGVFTQEEFFDKLKQVKGEYESRKGS
jgi:hypothetical protein